MSRPLADVGLLQQTYGYEEALSGVPGSLGIPFSPITMSGGVADPGLYNLPGLTPVTTETATYAVGGVDVTDAKNDVLSKFVVATGADGYKTAFSLGEIDPKFGAQPVLVASSDTAGQLGPTGSDGLAPILFTLQSEWRH